MFRENYVTLSDRGARVARLRLRPWPGIVPSQMFRASSTGSTNGMETKWSLDPSTLLGEACKRYAEPGARQFPPKSSISGTGSTSSHRASSTWSRSLAAGYSTG
jgi:hypothetical protein